jgi:hypothetical protein
MEPKMNSNESLSLEYRYRFTLCHIFTWSIIGVDMNVGVGLKINLVIKND